jgi:tetratricopeptide (TPR) repeat protein
VDAARGLEDKHMLAFALNSAGIACLQQQGMGAQARAYFDEGLASARESRDAETTSMLLLNLGAAAAAEGDYTAARASIEEALGLCVSARTRAIGLLNLGEFSLREGDLAVSRFHLREALALLSGIGDRHHIAGTLEWMVALALEEGDAERAARLAGAAQAIGDSTEAMREWLNQEPWERTLARLHEVLEAEVFEREWARGRAMSFEEAVAEALAPE